MSLLSPAFFVLFFLLFSSSSSEFQNTTKQHGRTSTARLLKEKGIIIFKVSSRSRESSYHPLTRRRSFSRREKIFYSTDAHLKGEASCLLRRLSPSSRGGGRTAAYNRSRFFFSPIIKRARERVLLEREREQRRTTNVTTTTTTTRSSHQKRREQNGQRNKRERKRQTEERRKSIDASLSKKSRPKLTFDFDLSRFLQSQNQNKQTNKTTLR